MYCDWPYLGRCCFCMPLRKGAIILAYVNIIYCAFMIGMVSYLIHHNETVSYYVYSRLLDFPAELCITIYCADVLFSFALIYGAHTKSAIHIKAYYYFALVSTIAIVVLQIIDLFEEGYQYYLVLDTFLFMFAGLCMQVYFITVVRSLLKKTETDGPHVYDNQLHQIVSGELKVESNGVYNNLTTPAVV